MPDTVAGPRRHCTDFRVPRSLSVVREVYAFVRGAASTLAKSALSLARFDSYAVRAAGAGEGSHSKAASRSAIARTSASAFDGRADLPARPPTAAMANRGSDRRDA